MCGEASGLEARRSISRRRAVSGLLPLWEKVARTPSPRRRGVVSADDRPPHPASLLRSRPLPQGEMRYAKAHVAAVVTPPSTTMVWPVMKVEASEARYATAPAISSGSPMRRSGVAGARRFRLLVFPQRAGEIGLHQARRHAIDAHALRAPFAGEAAAQREVGGFGDAVGADHGGAAQAADRGDDDDRAVAAFGHLRDRHRRRARCCS